MTNSFLYHLQTIILRNYRGRWAQAQMRFVVSCPESQTNSPSFRADRFNVGSPRPLRNFAHYWPILCETKTISCPPPIYPQHSSNISSYISVYIGWPRKTHYEHEVTEKKRKGDQGREGKRGWVSERKSERNWKMEREEDKRGRERKESKKNLDEKGEQ